MSLRQNELRLSINTSITAFIYSYFSLARVIHQNTHENKFWTHEMLTRKNFGPAKHPQ